MITKNIKEYKKRLIKGFTIKNKIAYYLLIHQVRIIKHGLGYSYKTRINPFNPLTYIYIILSIIIACISFVCTDLVSEIIRAFKWN